MTIFQRVSFHAALTALAKLSAQRAWPGVDHGKAAQQRPAGGVSCALIAQPVGQQGGVVGGDGRLRRTVHGKRCPFQAQLAVKRLALALQVLADGQGRKRFGDGMVILLQDKGWQTRLAVGVLCGRRLDTGLDDNGYNCKDPPDKGKFLTSMSNPVNPQPNIAQRRPSRCYRKKLPLIICFVFQYAQGGFDHWASIRDNLPKILHKYGSTKGAV